MTMWMLLLGIILLFLVCHIIPVTDTHMSFSSVIRTENLTMKKNSCSG